MIKLKQVTRTFSDATAGYSVELTKEYTLQKFVNEVLSNEKRWGYLAIDSEISIFGDPCCEYKYDKLLTKFPSEILTKKVVSAKARGGYGNMDYSIEIK